MDNDNKIENINNRHQEVLLFLNEELKKIKKSSTEETYDIKKEYAKSKKYRSPFTFLVLLGTFIVVFGISYATYRIISQKNDEIAVSLNNFDDLNLKSLLDTITKAQDSYDNAIKNKATLEATKNRLIKEAEDKRDNDFFVLDSLKLSKNEYRNRSLEINKEYTDSINTINLEYEPQITELNSQIENYQKQLAEYDTSKVKSAQEQEKAINSERQLKQLEIQALTDKYEAQIAELKQNIDDLQVAHSQEIRKSVTTVQEKYQAEIDSLDPILKDSKAENLLKDTETFQIEDFDANFIISENSINDKNLISEMEKFQEYFDNYQYLNSKIASIPQKNTIPTYIEANNSFVKKMSETFSQSATELYAQNEELKNQMENKIKRSEEIYTKILTSSKANALIYSANSLDDIQIFIAERSRFLVDKKNGVNAEFSIGKTTIKGTILLDKDNIFRFYIKSDSENEPSLEIKTISPGTLVKLLTK